MADLDQFQRAEPDISEEMIAARAADNPEYGRQAEQYLTEIATEALLLFTNSLYTVAVREVASIPGWPPMWHLSIKRNDKQPIHDWRHLQQIKNMIAGTMLERATRLQPELGLTYEDGKECEAVELYPKESRLVDEANQYHLFVLMHPQMAFPFGSPQRLVSTPEEAAAVGAIQRPFGNPLAPLKGTTTRADRRRLIRLQR